MITFKQLRTQLNEMSMIIPKMDDHKLNTREGNKKEFEYYIKSVEEIEDITPEIKLYEGDYGKFRVYFAANPVKQEIYYFMKYKRDSNNKLGRFVYQNWLWMNKAYRSEVGYLPNQLFFSLIDDYFTIATDSEQTQDGKSFWIKRLKDAFNKHLNVYYYNDKTEELIRLNNSSDIETFDEKYQIWNEHESSLDKMFVISKKHLG